MNSLNSILLEGSLTENPTYSKEVKACHFGITSKRFCKGIDEVEISFFKIVAYGKLAATCSEYLKKGRGVRAVGRLKQDNWKEDGKRKMEIYIVAEHVEFKPEK